MSKNGVANGLRVLRAVLAVHIDHQSLRGFHSEEGSSRGDTQRQLVVKWTFSNSGLAYDDADLARVQQSFDDDFLTRLLGALFVDLRRRVEPELFQQCCVE